MWYKFDATQWFMFGNSIMAQLLLQDVATQYFIYDNMLAYTQLWSKKLMQQFPPVNITLVAPSRNLNENWQVKTSFCNLFENTSQVGRLETSDWRNQMIWQKEVYGRYIYQCSNINNNYIMHMIQWMITNCQRQHEETYRLHTGNTSWLFV